MATIAVAAAISSAGASAGTTLLLTAVATYIDSKYVMPRLAKTPESNLGDLTISSGREGDPWHYGIGQHTRIPGFMAWAPREFDVVETTAGKGGPSGTRNDYFTDVFWIFARTDGIPVFNIPRIWMNGRLRYDSTDAMLRATFVPGIQDIWFEALSTNPFGTTDDRVIIRTLDQSFFDLTRFQAGLDVTIVGALEDPLFSNSNNGTYRVRSTGTSTDGTTWMIINNETGLTSANPAVPGPLGVHVIYQERPAADTGLYDWIAIRNGSRAHGVIGQIEAIEGVGQVPHWNSFAGVYFDRLKLLDFGNRMPNMEAQVQFSENPVTLQEALTALLSRHFLLDSDQIDLTLLDDNEEIVHGYWWATPYDVQILQPIILAYDLVLAEVGGKLHVYKRADAPEFDVDVNDLDAGEDGASIGSILDVFEEDDGQSPGYVTVTYKNLDAELAQGVQQVRRPDLPSNPELEINFNALTLTDDQARQIANRFLYEKVGSRQELEISLPPKYAAVTEGSYLNFTVEGKAWRMFVRTIRRGAQQLKICSGLMNPAWARELPEIPTEPGGYQVGSINTYSPPEMVMVILDVPPLDNATAMDPFLYFSGAARYYSANYLGADLYFEPLAGSGFGFSAPFPAENVMGFLRGTMDVGEPGYVNHAGTVIVELIQGELFSINDAQLQSGFNMCLIGKELFNFRDARLIDDPGVADNTYELTTLQRGLRGTERFIEEHVYDDLFVLIRLPALIAQQFGLSTIGTTHAYKMVPANALVDSVDPVEITSEGNGVRPFEPAHVLGLSLQAFGQAGQSVIISWTRRTRLIVPALATPDGPFAESTELYDLVIYQGETSVVVRTIPLTQNRYTYLYDQRVTDGNTGSFMVGVIAVGASVSSYEAQVVLPNTL